MLGARVVAAAEILHFSRLGLLQTVYILMCHSERRECPGRPWNLSIEYIVDICYSSRH